MASSQHMLDEPKTAKGRRRLVAPSEYRYAFPSSKRKIGEALGVDDVKECLFTIYSLARLSVRVLAGALIRIGPFEIKIELAHYLYQFSEGAARIHKRLRELGVSMQHLEQRLSAGLECMGDDILQENDPIVFSMRFRDGLVEEISRRLTLFVDQTDSLLDQPSIRAVRTLQDDLADMLHWFIAIEQAAIQAGDDPRIWQEKAGSVRPTLDAFLQDGSTPAFEPRYIRPHACERDDRFSTFHHTRRYEVSDFMKSATSLSEFEAARFELFCVQRDELDAVETFANIIYDLRPSFELELFLARLVWDEARHAEMGQQSLERLGYDPFAVPCGVIGINVRSPLAPIVAFAQISIFGELNQVGALKRMSDRCYAEGDPANGIAFDFTHADEAMHLRVGRAWLRSLAQESSMSLDELEKAALELAIKRLREEGVLNEDYTNQITAKDIFNLIGE